MKRLNEIAQAKAWLDLFRPLPPEVVGELRSRMEVRLTHHSTALEGNTLTQSETQIVIEKGITIAGKSVTEHLEVIGHKEALDFVYLLAAGEEPIGERQIREIHGLVMKGQGGADVGAYRTLDVMAAGTGFNYPSHVKVPELMAEFTQWIVADGNIHPIEQASVAHLRFVTIHPFRDGNGRVGRLLLNLLLLRAGYPIAVIPVESRAQYIDALVAAQQRGEEQPLLALVADGVKSSLREMLEVCINASPSRQPPAESVSAIQAWLA